MNTLITLLKKNLGIIIVFIMLLGGLSMYLRFHKSLLLEFFVE